MTRATLFLGDLADALRIIDPQDSETEARIAKLLGLPPMTGSERQWPADPEPSAPPIEGEAPPPMPVAKRDERAPRFFSSQLQSLLPPNASKASVTFASPRAPISLSGTEEDVPQLPLDPLLRPASSRAILSAAVSTNLAIGIDIQRTLEKLARRDTLDHLPLRHVRSVRRGVQVLLDKSASMTPFLRDQALVIEALGRIVGRQMLEVASFAGAPQRGLRHGLRVARPYRPPVAGTPVVVLTDLGIAQPQTAEWPATTEEWLAFAAIAAKADCPLIAFVPYEAKRWPPVLRRTITILPWDRSLTAGQAAKRSRTRA